MTYYWNQFGFYPEEVTALLGVHTCGQMHAENSGFEGKWKEDIDEVSDLRNRFIVHNFNDFF